MENKLVVKTTKDSFAQLPEAEVECYCKEEYELFQFFNENGWYDISASDIKGFSKE